ncbi:MAG: M1 family metallopeptidase [Gemmatimonadetes bacterium]|nr:M1 family metallopeptidase [Gemmatimonadota bacterium]
MPRSPMLAAALVLSSALPLAAQAPAPYWQQEVHYTIEGRLDEAPGVFSGSARVEYVNHSPETLSELFFHLYLNAFRPGSRWAEVEERADYDFAGLADPDYGFERLRSVRVGQQTVRPEYPGAPDSVVVRIPLPDPLRPGQRTVVTLEWDARLSTLCRRQCRQGRHFDFAQWYPRIATFDRGGWQAHTLYPQGEFYGEFATYDVTVDVAADQVLGGTGVVVSGDPGWSPVPGSPLPEPVLQRDWYDAAPPPSLGVLTGEASSGRKRVRFRAEDVHHFAWTANPDYRYEGGAWGDIAIHVLYRPGDEDEWGSGQVVERTARALAFLNEVFGPYPWPQLTNVHRLEGGGTEFPMMLMDGSGGLGLILHEGTHQYAHGILANNEWREGWMDEGMASFVTSWYAEREGGASRGEIWDRLVEQVGALDVPHPIGQVAEDFPDFQTYGLMTYTKPSVVLYMLREELGEETFLRGLRAYFAKNALRHVTQRDLRDAMEWVSGRDLGWFFHQWIDQAATLDYAIAEAQTRQAGSGWQTTVRVTRTGEAWMPVDVRVGERTVRLEGRERTQTLTVETPDRPARVELDPDRKMLDRDRSNNVREPGGD